MLQRGSRRAIFLGGSFAAVVLLLWAQVPPAVAAPLPLELRLPDSTVTLPVLPSGSTSYVSLKALAAALKATMQDGPMGGVAVSWEGRRKITFRLNRRQVATPEGIILLSAPPRQRGGQWWVPLDGAGLIARERFGADSVRWDPQSRRMTIASPTALIRALRIGSHPDRLRVVLEAGSAVSWSVQPGKGGLLIVFLPGASLSPSIVRKDFRNGPLRSVEPGQGQEGAEIRLALAAPSTEARWFTLENPFRIVVDLPRNGHAPQAAAGDLTPGNETGTHGAQPTAARPPSRALPSGSLESEASTTDAATQPPGHPPAGAPPDLKPGNMEARVPALPPGLHRRDGSGPEAARPAPAPGPAPEAPAVSGRGALTIVIDPGHGGKDTGAIGPRGLKEKDVVLDIGLRLRRLLTDRLGARVILTRSDDTLIPLEERTTIANKAQADFFISLHVNAAPQVRATGVETYYLSREPSDGDARASATRENLALHLEGIGPQEQEGLRAILWDMAQTLSLRESSALAEMLLEDLARVLRKENRGVKHGPFVVLMTAGMPSTLVEIGFISNPHEERRMQDEAYRQQIANSLAQGIERFATRYQRRIGMQSPRPGRS